MLKEIVIAIQAYFQAHHFIIKHRLWKWILIPGIIYAILFFTGIYFFWISSTHAIDYLFFVTGLKQWVQALQNGMREEQVAFDFLDSPEYLSKGDRYFVDAMYQSLLGRSFVTSQ